MKDPKEIRKEIKETRKKTRKARKSKKLQGKLAKSLEKLKDTKDVYSIVKSKKTKENPKTSRTWEEKEISSKRGKRILERQKRRGKSVSKSGTLGDMKNESVKIRGGRKTLMKRGQ